jgi:hypothetical protein
MNIDNLHHLLLDDEEQCNFLGIDSEMLQKAKACDCDDKDENGICGYHLEEAQAEIRESIYDPTVRLYPV